MDNQNLNNKNNPNNNQKNQKKKKPGFSFIFFVTIFTALDTVNVLLDVLEDITLTISTIDAEGNL